MGRVLNRSLRLIWTIAIVVAVGLACATTVFSYLAAASASSAKCAGQELLQGYRSGAADFIALPLFSVIIAIAMIRGRRARRTREFLANADVMVVELGPLQLTYGMLLVCAALFGFVFFNAMSTVFSATRYAVISNYCNSIAASG